MVRRLNINNKSNKSFIQLAAIKIYYYLSRTNVRNIYHDLTVIIKFMTISESYRKYSRFNTHFQYEYFSRCTIYVEFAVGWIVGVDTLAGQEVDNVLWTILVAIGSRHLYVVYVVSKDKNV